MQQPDHLFHCTIGNKQPTTAQLIAIFLIVMATFVSVTLPKHALALDAMPDYATLVEQQGKVVVKITARKSSVSSDQMGQSPLQELPEELRRYFEQLPSNPNAPRGQRGQPSTGFGSGFIVSNDGYIVTNHHVIAGADDIEVSLQNRTSYVATLVGSDARTDLAVLKVEADNLPVAQLGDSDALKVGQWVLAIGSPFGFDYTATQGIVSALSRSLPSNDSNYVPFIQTDVAVNPGNSGGPLFDLEGKVVGVNSQIYTRSGGYMGLSFAIPVDVVKNVVTQLRDTGHVSRGWLGVSIQEVDRELAKTFGMDRPRGALVADVSINSPASTAGFEPGDVILTFNGKPVASSAKLPAIVGSTAINTEVDVIVLRAGLETTLQVMVGELNEIAANNRAEGKSSAVAGLTLKPLSKAQLEQSGVSSGLIVESVEPKSAAATSGIQPGDILISINRKNVKSVQEFREAFLEAPKGKPMPLLVARGNGRLYLPLTSEEP